MSLFAFGLNHTTAPVDVRERVSMDADTIGLALRELTTFTGIDEAAIVSTCNRTDLYCKVTDGNHDRAVDWFRGYHELTADEIIPYLYRHQDAAAVRHLLRVASGLDSLVLGEPQILGQVKDAHRIARETGAAGKILDRVFQQCFSVAKRVRTDTQIGSSPVSVAYAAVSLAKQIFGELEPYRALMLGAGETIELATRHLCAAGLRAPTIANRTVTNAERVAERFEGRAIRLDQVADHLPDVDIIVAATGASSPIITEEMLRRALETRRRRPLFIVDIAVPRDVEAAVAQLPDVFYYSVDDLDQVIQASLDNRREAAIEAEQLIEAHVGEIMGWLEAQAVFATIGEYRAQAAMLRDDVLAKAAKQLDGGKSPDKVLEFLANTLTNKLLHGPTAQLREAGAAGDPHILRAARTLFQLQDAADSDDGSGTAPVIDPVIDSGASPGTNKT